MRRRIWIVFAVAAAAALAAWRFWPSGAPSASSPVAGEPGSEAATAPDSVHADGPPPSPDKRRPPAPVRMQARSNTPAGPRAGLAVVFDGEERNEEWATRREGEVRVRAGRVLGDAAADGRPSATLGPVECRSRSCRLSLAADDPAVVARAVEGLGEEGGFFRFADQMTVEAAEPGDGGPRRVNVYLRFAR